MLVKFRDKDSQMTNKYVKGTSIPINWWISVELKKKEDPIRKICIELYLTMQIVKEIF